MGAEHVRRVVFAVFVRGAEAACRVGEDDDVGGLVGEGAGVVEVQDGGDEGEGVVRLAEGLGVGWYADGAGVGIWMDGLVGLRFLGD